MKTTGPIATAELFEHGDRQAVDLPEEFRFEGSAVSIRKEGTRVVLEPVRKMRKPASKEAKEEISRRMDALQAGPAIPGGRNQGTLQSKKIFD